MSQKTVSLAHELGLKVPQNLSVTSYTYSDVIPLSPMTAIHIPIREIARKCVEIIEQMLRGLTPSPAELEVQLAIRNTCGPANP